MSRDNGFARCQRAYDSMEDPYYWDDSKGEETTEEEEVEVTEHE